MSKGVCVMILAESSIYPFIKDYPTNFEIVTYKKNSLILQASEGNKYIWFLLDGEGSRVQQQRKAHRCG